ncbi:hypothetical protein, partial [Glutamicibacter nicotianae]|uniref:hypothetical protein n=1 Tax=Glutamicibacter nicotianae TaxID=37929 RepID=UPI001C3FEBCF
ILERRHHQRLPTGTKGHHYEHSGRIQNYNGAMLTKTTGVQNGMFHAEEHRRDLTSTDISKTSKGEARRLRR